MDRIRALSVINGQSELLPRWGRFASALRQRGFQVDVVHGKYPQWATTFADQQFANVHARAVGTGGDAQSLARRWHSLTHALACRLSPGFRLGQLLSIQALDPFAQPLLRECLRQPASLYIAHGVAALPAAALASRRYGGVLVYDATANCAGMQSSGDHPEDLYRAQIEQRFVEDAALITTASPLTANAYTDRFPTKPVETVLNTPVTSELPAPDIQNTSLKLLLVVQNLHPDTGLEFILEALGKLADTRISLTLVGHWQPGYQEHFMASAQQHNVRTEQIEVVDPYSQDALQDFAAQHDIGLVLGSPEHSQNARECVPEALFQYLHAGLFVLGTETPGMVAMEDIWGAAGLLHPHGDSEKLAAQIQALLANLQILKAGKAAARALAVSRYHWLLQSRKLLNGIRNAIAENLKR